MGTLRTKKLIVTFEGVGPEAVAYPGALEEIDKHASLDKDCDATGGVSSGGITAALFSMRYTISEMKNIALNTDYQKILQSTGIVDDVKRLISMDGIYDSQNLFSTITKYITDKTGNPLATFADFQKADYRDLRIVATRLRRKDGKGLFEPVMFSKETTPETPVAYAALASASIPGVFSPVRLHEASPGRFVLDEKNGQLFIDGGAASTVQPVTLYDYSPEVFAAEKLTGADSEPIPHCEPLEYTGLLLEAVAAQHHQKFTPGKINPATVSMQVIAAQDIQQFEDPSAAKPTCIFTHPLQAISDDVNNEIFGPRTHNFIAAKGDQRTFSIQRPPDIPQLDFSMTSGQKNELQQEGQKTVASSYAKKRVPIGLLYTLPPTDGSKKPAQPEEQKKEKQTPCISCVIM